MVVIEQKAARQKEQELREHEAQHICKHFEKLERDTNKTAERCRKADERMTKKEATLRL
jgi:hypothetical protein